MNTRRARPVITLRMRIAWAVPMLAICAFALLFGWWAATHWDVDMKRCLVQYARAQTTADSARIDRQPKNGRSRETCGDLRRDGTLDRYRRSIEAGRVRAG